ncbi:hypothetical protein PISL3812_06988 [Talaromyces islandicus]|uniref:Enoyl reductase (ER) domain-containing protein n=1 Tax=Talaromyces islandicus TaxID=28573 RepID=A0A0U1M2Z7_TALIS|nr:hypothetical protein PISL3812_06988 [Talaromyces islandicus]
MALPETMQAIQIKQFNAPYAVPQVAVPKPKSNQLSIRIKAAGFCHTDLMALNNEFNSPLPYIDSHEGAGVVEQVGSDVQGFVKGDHVGCINFDSSCGECPDCSAGRVIYCDRPQMKGLTIDGAWAEYMVADARTTVKIPESVDLVTAAPLMCAGLSVYGGIKKAGVPPGGSIGIIGIGGLGHIGTQLAKAMGYKVAAVDIKQTSLDLVNSRRLKPDISLLATEDPDGQGAQCYAGKVSWARCRCSRHRKQPAFDFAAAITRKHGTVVLLGQPDKGITMSFYNMIFRDLKLVGSLIGDTSDAEEPMNLVNDHKVEIKIKIWKLDQAEEMRQEYLSGKSEGKNVIVL